MAIFDNFPYTNIHDLNTDWLVKTVKKVYDKTELVDQAVIDAQERAESAENAVNEIKNIFVTPEMFGAVGDGITDDSDALIRALNSGKNVIGVPSSIYGVSKQIDGTVKAFNGNGAKIKLLNNVNRVFNFVNTEKVENLIFDCNNLSIQMAIEVTNTANTYIENIKLLNVYDLDNTYGTQLILIDGCDNVKINNIMCINCKKLGNGIVTDSAGSFKVIYVNDYEHVEITNVLVKDTHNIDVNDQIIAEDCDAIHLSSLNELSSAIIKNIVGYNCGKRIIKTQAPNIMISDVFGYNNQLDLTTLIGVQQYNVSKYAEGIIDNCILINEYSTNANQSLIASSEHVNITNCVLKPGNNNWAVLVLGDIDIENSKLFSNAFSLQGRTLNIDNCYFDGGVFIGETSLASNMTEVKISNSHINYTGATAISYPQLSHKYGKMFIVNTIFKSFRLTIENYIKISNCEFLDITDNDTILATAGDINIKDCYFKTKTGTVTRAIYLYGSTITSTCDGLVSDGLQFTYVGTGSLVAKNVDISKILGTSMTSLYVYPEYYSALPSAVNLKDGVLVLLETDGKLYKCVSASWTAVN